MKRGLVSALAVAAAATLAGPAVAAEAAAKKPLGWKLADQVHGSKKLSKAVSATRRVLALSGVATVSEGRQLVAPVQPASRWQLMARETVYMALGATNPQVKLSSIGNYLQAMGADIDGQPAGRAFPQMVQSWMSAARSRPSDPLSQPALFVLRSQSKRVTLRKYYELELRPQDMVLSSLEALIVLANLERVIEPGTPPEELSQPEPDPYEEDPFWDEEEPPMASASQDGGGPCASVKAGLDALGPVASGAADVVIGSATGSAIEAYADSLRSGSGAKVGKVLTGLDIADRMWRTYAFSQHIDVDVYPVDGNGELKGGRVHKPTNGQRKRVGFLAVVGLTPKERKELEKQLELAKDHAFQESLRNCASLHGITIPKSPYGDLAKEMEGWSALWTPHWRGDSEVRVYRKTMRSKLTRLDFADAGTVLEVGVIDEPRVVHKNDDHALTLIAEYPATVEISAQKPPNPTSIAKLALAIAGAPGGDVAGPVGELLEGLFRTLAKPKGTGKLIVEEHAKDPCDEFWQTFRGGKQKGGASC